MEKKKKKKKYSAPRIKEKDMTGHFMVCRQNSNQCPPGTAIKKSGQCF